jgi:hypothetical protein
MKIFFLLLTFLFLHSCKEKDILQKENLDLKTNRLIKESINSEEEMIDTYDSISTTNLDTLRFSDFKLILEDIIEKTSDENKNNRIKFRIDSIRNLIDKKEHKYRIKRQLKFPFFGQIRFLIVERVFHFNNTCDSITYWYDNDVQF